MRTLHSSASVLWLLLALLLFYAHTVDAIPSQIHTSIANVSSTSIDIYISWADIPVSDPTGIVLYGPDFQNLTSISIATAYNTTLPDHGIIIYHALLTGLPGRSSFVYTVGPVSPLSARSAIYRVQTPPLSSNSTSSQSDPPSQSLSTLAQDPDVFSFIVVADSGLTQEANAVVQSMLNYVDNSFIPLPGKTTIQPIHTIFFPGGLAYVNQPQGNPESLWDTFFSQVAPISASIPTQFSLGTPDVQPSPVFSSAFDLRTRSFSSSVTNSTHWFSYNIHSAHIIFLSATDNYTVGSDQYQWLDSDLRSVNRTLYPSVIVLCHRPMYTSLLSSATDASILRAAWGPLFNQHGGVQLFLAGSVKGFERTFPIDSSGNMRSNGTIYSTIGTAGMALDQALVLNLKPETWSACRRATYGFMRVDIFKSNSSISAHFISADSMQVQDSFTVPITSWETCDSKSQRSTEFVVYIIVISVASITLLLPVAWYASNRWQKRLQEQGRDVDSYDEL